MTTSSTLLTLSGIAAFSLILTSCDSGSEPQAVGDDSYPLKVCLVSGEDLSSMGGPVAIEHEGQTVKFCCESCIEDFKEAPGNYLPKLTEASGK